MSSPARPDSAPPTPSDPAARPRPFAQRLGLLLILLVLPAAAVTLPSVVITHVFGRWPRSKAAASPTPTPDTAGLRHELEGRAQGLLPAPAPLAADPVRVSVHDPTHVGPRVEKIKAQAQRFGGAAVEGLAAGGEQHLFVDLPAGTADAFRQAVTGNTPVETLPSPAPASPAGSLAAARDQVEVFVRTAADDE